MNTRSLAVLLLAAVVTSAAYGDEVMRGDVVRNTAARVVMCPAPPRTEVLSSELHSKGWLYTGDSVAFDSVGILYAAGEATLDSFDSTLQNIRSVKLLEPAIALAVDAAGFAYVAGQSGRMYVYSPGGILQRSFTLPGLSAPSGPISIDVTPDGSTLVYVGNGASANRFNTCAQLALSPLAPGERFEAVRALSDGGFAGATAGHIKFYDATGRVLYDVLAPPGGPIAALSFDTDPQSMWIANGEFLLRMSLVDRSISARTSVFDPRTIAVFGERRPNAATVPQPVPKRRSARH